MLDQRSRNYTITQFIKTLSDEQVLETIKKLEQEKQIKCSVIGGIEHTKKEKKHRHILIMFYNKKSINQVRELFPNCHIEPLIGTPNDMYNYLSKENKPIYDTYISFIRNTQLTTKEKLNEVYQRLLDGETLISIMRDNALSDVCIKNYHNLKHIEYDLSHKYSAPNIISNKTQS